MKKVTMTVAIGLMMLTLASCSSKPKTMENNTTTTVDVNSTEFTKETLSKFNGMNNEKAYIAVNGTVYDVSDSKDWKNGEHNGVKAGEDASSLIGNSPHGDSVLKGLPVVGTYVN